MFIINIVNNIYRYCFKLYICKKKNKKMKRLSQEEFIERVNELHNKKYIYTKVNYKNSETPVCVICPIHDEFWIKPELHLRGHGCPKCVKNGIKYTTETFIEKAKVIHKDKCIYTKVNYINSQTPVTITCPIHGDFLQTPKKHLQGHGCPQCAIENNISETKIYEYIKDNINRQIIKQKKFKWLNGKSLDIYIPSMKIAVEYQGRQHFVPVSIYGGEKHFLKQKQRDIDKYNECKEHNIKLFYFSKEKEIPNEYLDIIYTEEEELLKAINSYNKQI